MILLDLFGRKSPIIMKFNLLLLGILLFLSVSCQESISNSHSEIDKQIAALTTQEAKESYLANIFDEDQRVRGPEDAEIMLKYGKDSKEYKDNVKALLKQDEINLQKIERYLEQYGYPDKDQFGWKAVSAPWAVIHHQSDLDIRNRNFEILYQAYLDGNIDDGAFSFYLGRTYTFTFGKRLEMQSPFQSKDEIALLIKELKLKKQKP